MLTKIIELLKTGSVKNGTYFGSGEQFEPPYFIVKKEEDFRGTIYRVIGHFQQGQKIFLEDYIEGEVVNVLDGWMTTDRKGNYCRLSLENIILNIPPSDDLTICEEAVFLSPNPPKENM